MIQDILKADPVRVVKNDPAVLQIESRPIRRTALGVAAILVAVAASMAAMADGAWGTGLTVLIVAAVVGGAFLSEVAQVTQLRLDRDTGTARFRVTTLRGRDEQCLNLSEITGAELQIRYGSAAGNNEIRLVLTLQEGSTPHEAVLPLARPQSADVAQLAKIINAWLSEPSQGSAA